MNTEKNSSVWDEIISILTKFLTKHWWKLALIIIAAGIAVSGFTVKTKNTEFKKDGIILPGK